MSAIRHRNRMIRLAALVSIAVAFAPCLEAAGLQTGHYVFAVQYSPVCLSGVYSLTAGEMTTGCSLKASIDVNGAVTGMLDMRTLKGPTSGTLTREDNTLALHLETSGQDPSMTPSQIDGVLQANKFVGTATTSNGTVPCTLDISAVEPLNVTF